jgi:hypothetical protein
VLKTQTKIALPQKLQDIFYLNFGYRGIIICFKTRSDLNYYILRGLIFISLFMWILPLRLFAVRLTAHLKEGWPKRSGWLSV